ncbi:MAG: ABC transporter ATP-binding protein [Verrucomicrobia bacterium]|nr:ABC transporter ATP-binding protein [Verrucomicrobiota bacterium]
MSHVIETKGLTQRFGKTEAVKNLTLQVPQGSIFAFLGPNGAGKTTTIKAFMNILEPSEGTATVFGVDSRRLGPDQFSRIGYVSENQELPEWMRVGQFLEYCKPMYPSWDDEFCGKLLKQFSLSRDQKIKSMSRGMKVKTALLSSLAYRPQLLVLDEPFSGLDPLVRDEFIRGVLELTEQESWTVFISSHDIDEVERLADWVGILNQGRLELAEAIVSLQARFRKIEVVVRGEGAIPKTLPEHWLTLEKAAHTIRFVDSRYAENETEKTIPVHFPDCAGVTAQPMSLREIFLTLARTYRLVA